MKKLKDFLKNIRFGPRSIPVMLFLLCLVAYGLFTPFLGYYWDDWEPIQVLRLYGLSEMWNYFRTDRPLSAWTYFVSAPLLGTTPWAWQGFAVALRYLTTLAMVWSLSRLWPERKRELAVAAALFAVYPIFMQQAIAVSYHQHWMGFLLYFLSIGCMLQAARQPEKAWLFHLLGVLAAGAHLAIFEYFAGLEVLRPVLLWVLLVHQEKANRNRLRGVLLHWLPYLLVIGGYAMWRLFLVAPQVETNYPTLIFDFFKQPLSTALHLVQLSVQDLVFFLFTSWYRTLTPEILGDWTPSMLLFAVAMVVTALGLVFYLLRLEAAPEDNPEGYRSRWVMEAFGVGLAAMVLGTLPVWVTDRQVWLPGLFSDRFGLAAMFGASLALAALLRWVASNWKKTALIAGILVGLAVGLQLRTANDFRWSWIRQQRVYWQLYWRAPAVKPNTIFLADNTLFPYVYPNFSFNVLYFSGNDPANMGLKFLYLKEALGNDPGFFSENKPYQKTFRNFVFNGHTQDIVLLYYDPPHNSNCVWVLTPEDVDNPYLSDRIRQALPVSGTRRILTEPTGALYPPREIFGEEPEPDWCYLYQKASLAKQTGDWQQVAALGDQAAEMGIAPDSTEANSPQEWLPFIEGYARTGEWERAAALTVVNSQIDSNYEPALCVLWERLKVEGPQDSDAEAAVDQVWQALECDTRLAARAEALGLPPAGQE